MSNTTLLRDYIDAALEARLDKNAHQAFLVLLRQLVGFGKASDPLTDGRISNLSGIRKDRVQDAVQKVAAAGLIDADIRDNGWNRYSIPAVFFAGDRPARFFAPAFPSSGEISQPMGGKPNGWEHTEYSPYRDLPTTDNTTTPAVEPAVCDVDLNPVEEIQKPQAVSEADYLALLPSLRKLPNTQALDVLALTQAAILNRSITTTVQRFAGGLIKMARNGTLDTAALAKPVEASKPTSPAPAVEASNRAQEDAHLRRLAELAGVPLDCLLPKTENPATAATVPGEAKMIPTTSKSLENQHAT